MSTTSELPTTQPQAQQEKEPMFKVVGPPLGLTTQGWPFWPVGDPAEGWFIFRTTPLPAAAGGKQ